MITRLIKPLLSRSFFLFGARGTGKSTWIRHEFEAEKCWVIDLLTAKDSETYIGRPDQLEYALEAIRSKSKIEWVVIDEIQKDPQLLDVVHSEIEKHKRFKFLLTGSSARKLKRGGANLLAGRAGWNSFFPLTSFELKEDFSLHDALEWGTLPSVVGMSREEKTDYLRSYAHTYLKEEILEEQLSRNAIGFKRFLEVAAQMNAKILNYSKIARDVHLESPTIKTYFDILEDTFLGIRLQAFDRSIRKQQTTHPKFYLFDLGVRRALLRSLDSNLRPGSSEYGEVFESWVITEIHRLNEILKKDFAMFYYRTKDDAEVDLILEKPGTPLTLIEIKSAKTIDETEVKSFEKNTAAFKSKRLLYLSQSPTPQKIGKVECLPYLQALREIFE